MLMSIRDKPEATPLPVLSLANGDYYVNDNTTLGYIYNIAVALAPVFANELSDSS
jgi:hypothetical protein